MASETRSKAGIPALAGLAGMAWMQQGKLLIEEAAPDLELKMKWELDSSTKKQIAFCKHDKVTIDDYAGRLIALVNIIDYMKRGSATSRLKWNNWKNC